MHPSSLRPEGGAPASWTVYPSLGECDLKRNPAQTDNTRSKTLVLFLKGGTYLETRRNTILLARCTCPVGYSHTGARDRQSGRDFWLKPTSASPLPLQRRGLRRAKALSCQRPAVAGKLYHRRPFDVVTVEHDDWLWDRLPYPGTG